MSRIPHLLDKRLTDGGEVFSLKLHRTLPQKYLLVLISVRESKSQVLVRLEGLGKLKTFNDLIETRTRDLPSCSTVPQQSTLRHEDAYVLGRG
jgi:hypothetical protein